MCVFSFNGAYFAVNRGIVFALTVTVSENWDARCSLHLHKTFNIYTEFREDDDRKISNRFSQTSSFVSYVFGGFAKETPKKRWTKSWLPVTRSAYAEKHRQGEPSFTNYAWVKDESNRRILRVHFYWEVSVCFFFFLGGGRKTTKRRKHGTHTHNFVMGSLQRKIGNCEFQWFETSRVINQRSAPNVWRKCCLLAFSFKRGIFLLKETVFLRIHDHLKASGIWMSSSILVCMY